MAYVVTNGNAVYKGACMHKRCLACICYICQVCCRSAAATKIQCLAAFGMSSPSIG